MNPTEERVEQAIARLGITDADEEVVTTEPKDDKPTEEAKTVADDKEVEKTDESEQEAEKEDNEEPEGFTAEDALEVEEVAEEPAASPTDASGIQLSPAEQKYVIDNIGDPLVIRGMRGDKEVELKVYDPTQIPRDFTFGSQADLLAAQQGFQRLENKAQQLLGNFRNEQSQSQAADFEKRENEGIRQDVAELQRDGDFPKFKIKPGEKGFDDDPAAIQMAEVMEIMTKTNDQYMKEYQQGRPYKHIGFKEAFDTYQKINGSKAKETAQKQEDQERKEVADKVGTNRGLSASKVVKPTVRPGTTTRDILNRIELGEY